jgi:hypothetical protein
MSVDDIATWVLSELARDIKVSFGYDVPIMVDYTYAKKESSEHVGSGEMSIGAKQTVSKSGFAENFADY